MEGIVLLVLSVFMLLVVLSKLKSLLVAKPKHNLPPGPWTLPVIGSLHHLVAGTNIHRVMRRLAQKHGSLMTLRLGEVPALVVSSPQAAEEVMKTHDVTFSDRHVNATLSVLAFDCKDVAFAPYGERWRQLGKICVLELLSASRVQSFRRIREDEAARFMENLAASAGAGAAAVNLSKMISRFINDTFVRESVGSRCKYQDEYLDALGTALRQTSGLAVADLFPSSRLVQVLDTAPRKVLACRDRMQRILEQVIQDTKEDVDRGGEAAAAGTGREGFVGVLLRLQKERSTPIPLDDDTIVAVLFDIFAAGSETSSTTLNWCMTELVRTPEAMAKVQAEVRAAFKGKSTVGEDDLKGLSYLKLVIKEALRLHTPAPLLVPRKCRETCRVMGYDVPKGTVVFVNMWAICRDPKYWDDPEEFKPERFENSNLDYKGTNFEFLPFGAGRRICPGINLGVGNIELALASLLYHFDWKLPDGIDPKDVDVSEAAGLVASKKTSLILHPVTRIPPENV
ncbi:unnamed protein product [Miscanthus lutarioriparius]|uniref:Cytochrome P450 n=1 Tax=Miscanthus lutarioriparius TaxID=422564 RepID=A0A811P200_9POAL|nr:unnamed protein product [Miscanthus lutarioriparius]